MMKRYIGVHKKDGNSRLKNYLKKVALVILIILFSVFMVSPNKSCAYNDYNIINSPTSNIQQIEIWAKKKRANDLFMSWVPLAYDIAVHHKVDPTVMIAQTAIETGYGDFGGVLDASYFNTCGMKTNKGGGNYNKNAHQRFNSWKDSFIAQAQHLRLYAGLDDLSGEKIYDVRHFKEIKGTAKTVNELGEKWASNINYGLYINQLCDEIIGTKVEITNESNRDVDKSRTIIVVNNIPNKKNSEYLMEVIQRGNEFKYTEYIKDMLGRGRDGSFIDYVKDILGRK